MTITIIVIAILPAILPPSATAVSKSVASPDGGDDTKNLRNATIAIPFAKLGQSSDYASFRVFKPFFKEEQSKHPDLPWPIYFSQDMVVDKNGHASAKTMFGRIYVSTGSDTGTNGFLQKSIELPLEGNTTGQVTLILNRTGAIVGKVYDEFGHPLAGAVIDVSGIAIYNNETGQAERCEIYASDISGYDGTYVITAGIDSTCEYRITATMPLYPDYSRWYLNPFLERQVADGNGKDDAKNISSNKILFQFRPPDYNNQPLYEPTTIERVKLEHDNVTTVNITVHSEKESPGRISGRVIDTNGSPMASAIVTATSNGQSKNGMTDKAGNFLIRNLQAGNYTIQVSPIDRKLVVMQVANVIVNEHEGNQGQTVNVGNIMGEESASIGGKLVLSDGTPIPGVYVDIRPIKLDRGYENYYPCDYCIVSSFPDELDQRGTDKQGRFMLAKDLPPGVYKVSINNYEVTIGDKRIQLDPTKIIVDTHLDKQITDADLVFNYTVLQDFAPQRENQTAIRFDGYVVDNEGNPVKGASVVADTFIKGFGRSREFTAQVDDDGFYSFYVLKKDIPEAKDGLEWSMLLDPTPELASPAYNINYDNIKNGMHDVAIYGSNSDEQRDGIVAYWGEEKRINFALHKFSIDDILTSRLEVDVRGEPAKYSLPQKQYVLSAKLMDEIPADNSDMSGVNNDLYITTNSTLVGSWADRNDNSINVQISPMAGTIGTMDIVIPKSIASGIGRVLFDGKETMDGSSSQAYGDYAKDAEVSVSSNSTHTKISLTYDERFNTIEIQAARVVPEFGSSLAATIIVAALLGCAIVSARRLESVVRK